MTHSSLLKSSFFLGLMLIASVNLSGCMERGSSREAQVEGPIEGWSDIALPENAIWEKTLVSGQVENHNYTVAMSESEFWEFTEESMIYNGWTISKAFRDGREFTKEEDRVGISVNGEKETGLNVFVIIEPKDAYADKEEK